MKRAIAYLRKSTDLQETSLEQQKENILHFARTHSIKVIEFFAEEACGESVEGRPQFRRMIECCKSKELFQYVLVYDVSRWGRFENPKEAVYWEVEAEKAGRRVIFISEGFKEESIGTSITNFVKSAEASEYLKNIRRQTTRGMIYYAKDGYWMGGRPPYGYNRAIVESGRIIEVLPEGKQKNIKGQKIKLVINKEQARIIRIIFIMFTKQGMSVNSIVGHLNQSNYPPPRGHMWSKSSIWRILHNDAYIGTLIYNRENGHKRHGKHKYNPQDKWIIVENAHEPIIPKELWEMVKSRTKQAFLGGRFLSKGSRPSSAYLLSGFIICEKCGSNFHGRRYSNKNSVTRLYRCGGYNMYGNDACTRWEVSAERLEKFAVTQIQRKIDNPSWRRELRKELSKILKVVEHKSSDRLHAIDKEIKELSLKIENWKKAIEKGIDLDNAVDIVNKYAFQREQLYREKTKLCEKVGNGNVDKAVDKMLTYVNDFNNVLTHGEPEKKKDFMKIFIREIRMCPDKRQAKILLYKRPLSDVTMEDKACEEIIYQN